MVKLASDITPEELQVFLQDTDEQLQLLDEDVIKLENEGDNPELLQEIFRAAHTIKGSSAMLGYEMMAELTHAMENILDKLRHGTLRVTTPIADALLNALDHLRILRGNLTADTETEIDVTSVIATLDELASGQPEAPAPKRTARKKHSEKKPPEKQKSPKVPVPLTKQNLQTLREALALGNRAYQITVETQKGCEWVSVRFFQVLNDLKEKGTVIASVPTQEEIEAEKNAGNLNLIFASLLSESEIEGAIAAIPDIATIQVAPYDPSDQAVLEETPAPEPEAEATAAAEEILQSASAKPTCPPPSGEKPAGSPETVRVSETVRIDVRRLDNLMNQIGELVVARTAFTRTGSILSTRYRDDQDVLSLTRTITNVSKIIDDLQLDITEARMMPVGTVFNRFPRMVRDLAQRAGKQIEFIVEGQETGIDRSVIEHIRDPLVHLLRNAVDHGIEPPEKRRAAGKPEKGTIRLSAAHEQSYIAITVEDDGKGIDGARLKEVAVKKGIIPSETAARMDDTEAIDLIFEPGLSTAEKITDVSGRGVGMDIVRQNIESLNGHIAVSTKLGQGTKFVLRLPLTLATIHGLLVVSAGVTFAIPLVSVSEVLRLRPEDIQTVTRKEVIRIRDRVVPLLKLDQVLRLRNADAPTNDMINVVVVKASERMVGLTIDSFREPQEVVVKSLGSFIGDIRGIAGASILGTGEVALIIDVPSLVKLVVLGE